MAMKTAFLVILILTGVGMVMAQTKTDKQTIIETIGNIFSGVDERNWGKVQGAMAKDVYLDYTSLAGGSPATLPLEKIVENWKGVLPGFQSTHHQIGNFQVNVTGDKATAIFSGLALHYLNNETWTVVGIYNFDLVKKSNGGWAVEKMKLNLQKQDGNLELPALAMQNVKNGVSFKTRKVTEENAAAVENFFTPLEKLDIQSFMKVWADDAKQIMPLAPNGFPGELSGKDAIFNQYKGLPDNFTSMKFPRRISATADPNKVIVQYTGIIPLKSGGEYNNNYVGIFEIKNGKVKTFTEYFDPFILENAFGKKLQDNFNVSKANVRQVEFKSEGLVLAGNLHLPQNFDDRKTYKAVVVTGSWTTVKEQMADTYATKLAGEGLVALTFDFRNYGASEGQPRNYENPEMKAQDIINAVRFLKTLNFVEAKNIGGLAICASAGYMSAAIAKGADFKAVNFVAPWLHNAEIARSIYGEENTKNLIAKSDAAKKKFAETGQVDYVVAASDKDSSAAMFGAFDYYLNPRRGAIKEWGNQFAVMAWKGWLEFDPIKQAEKVNIPVQIIHSKTAAVPNGAELYYSKLNSPKNIVWIEKATQFDFYDGEQLSTEAVKQSAKWFEKYLN
jgi:fermentation-respiration switch protein FrsA (DUF1100 family)/ketosteroid isomerase-like protein